MTYPIYQNGQAGEQELPDLSNYKDSKELTALFISVIRHHRFEAVERFLRADFPLDSEDRFGQTPKRELVKLKEQIGIDPELREDFQALYDRMIALFQRYHPTLNG